MNQVDHQYFQERLSAFVDNELPQSERTLVESHLQGCSECRRRVDDLRKLDDLVAAGSALNDSAYWEKAAQRIEAALPETGEVVDLSHERKRRSAIWWRLPAIAASVLILGYIGLHESDILKKDILQSPQPTLPAAEPPSQKSVEPQADSSIRTDKLETKVATDRTAKTESVPRKIAPATRDTAPTSTPEIKEKLDSVIADSYKPALSPSPAVAPPATDQMPSALVAPAPAKKPTPDVIVPAETPESEVVQDMNKTISVVPETVRSAAPAAAAQGQPVDSALDGRLQQASSEAASETAELANLRVRRDSLELALPRLREAAESVAKSKGGGVMSFDGGKGGDENLGSLLNQWTKEEKKAGVKQAETALVETWFQICRQSPDPYEIKQGVAYLRGVADKGKGDNRELAKQYLKQLDRQ